MTGEAVVTDAAAVTDDTVVVSEADEAAMPVVTDAAVVTDETEVTDEALVINKMPVL